MLGIECPVMLDIPGVRDALGHILEAVRNENLRMGRTLLDQDFTEYADLVRGR